MSDQTTFLRDDHPTLPPTPQRPPGSFASLDTSHLRRLRAALRVNIPGDPTHAAAVSTILGALLDEEIMARPPEAVHRDPPAEDTMPAGTQTIAFFDEPQTPIDHHPV